MNIKLLFSRNIISFNTSDFSPTFKHSVLFTIPSHEWKVNRGTGISPDTKASHSSVF